MKILRRLRRQQQRLVPSLQRSARHSMRRRVRSVFQNYKHAISLAIPRFRGRVIWLRCSLLCASASTLASPPPPRCLLLLPCLCLLLFGRTIHCWFCCVLLTTCSLLRVSVLSLCSQTLSSVDDPLNEAHDGEHNEARDEVLDDRVDEESILHVCSQSAGRARRSLRK